MKTSADFYDIVATIGVTLVFSALPSGWRVALGLALVVGVIAKVIKESL